MLWEYLLGQTPIREQMEKLMDELFRVDLPEFHRGKRLNIILEICCASLIRHLPEIVRLCGCGGHCLVASTLLQVQAAEKIGLKDARFPDRDPSGVLLEWSKIVGENYKENFKRKKLEAIGPSTLGPLRIIAVPCTRCYHGLQVM